MKKQKRISVEMTNDKDSIIFDLGVKNGRLRFKGGNISKFLEAIIFETPEGAKKNLKKLGITCKKIEILS